MYRYFHGSERNSIPAGLPSRLVDPMLRTIGEQPQFLRIGEGNHPRNELLRVVNQYPSKDEIRTKVLGDMFARDETNPYFNRPDNIAAIRSASEELGIPLERTGLRIATNPFRLEGDVADVDLLAQITNKAAGNLKRSGKPTVANALTRKAQFFAQPRSYSEIAVDGTEGVEAILEAYNKAEPRRTANSQGNRPILVQADGLDPNIGIPSGSPENIPWDNVEGMRGSNAYKPADELKRPRFIDTGEGQSLAGQVALLRRATKGLKVQGEGAVNLLDLVKAEQAKGTGIYTRSGEPINAEQKNLLDMGMADLEDRSFILRDPASANQTEQYRPTTRLGLQTLGLNADIGSETVLPAVDFGGMTLFPEERVVNRTIQPINRLTNDLSNRVLSGEVDLQNYEPFKSNRNTYGATQGRTPWREYYSDPFVYEDKGLDSEVSRLVKAVNEAPAQLENALTQQALANRRAIEASNKLKFLGQNQSVRMGLLPQGEGVVNLAREVRKDRRTAEMDAAKANDTIAQLKAAQELMGVEYMVKPKLWGNEILDDYARAARTRGAMKDGSYYEQEPRLDSFALWEDSMARDNARFKAVKAVEPRQARPSLAPTFSKPKPTIGELFGFTALTTEGLAKYRDIE